MDVVAVNVETHGSSVHLIVQIGDDKTVVVIGGAEARELGERLYKAGCSVNGAPRTT